MRNIERDCKVATICVGLLLMLAGCGKSTTASDAAPPSTQAPGVTGSTSLSQQLLGGEWVVEDVDKQAIVDRSHGTLNFTEDGRVAGRSFCNSYNGSYTLADNSLTIGPLASTKMACPPAIMNLEKLFTDVLADVSRFEVSADGALVLHTDDGRTITARRQRQSEVRLPCFGTELQAG